MKAWAMVVVGPALCALALGAFGQGIEAGRGEVKPQRESLAPAGFAEMAEDARREALRAPEADAVVSSLIAAEDVDLTGDERAYLQRWAHARSRTPENRVTARAALERIGMSRISTVAYCGDRAEFESALAEEIAKPAPPPNLEPAVFRWIANNDAGDSREVLMRQLLGTGQLSDRYVRWFRRHLVGLTPSEAVAVLQPELRALLARLDSEARTAAIRELRAQLILLRDIAGE